MLKSAQIASRLGFIRTADELADPEIPSTPTEAPAPAQSSSGAEPVSEDQVERLRKILVETIGEEGSDEEVFKTTKPLPAEPKATPAPANPPANDSNPNSVFRDRKPSDDEWLGLAQDHQAVLPSGPTKKHFADSEEDQPYESKLDPSGRTKLYFSKDEPPVSQK